MLICHDQVTVDLDVVVRTDLINFLTEESKERNATILCGCPIFERFYLLT